MIVDRHLERCGREKNGKGWRWMALSAYERQVLLLQLTVSMVPEEAYPRWTVGDFFGAVKKIFEAGGAELNMLEGPQDGDDGTAPGPRNLLRIADFGVGDDGTMTILFHHGDVSAPDPALVNVHSRKVRNAGKEDDDALVH